MYCKTDYNLFDCPKTYVKLDGTEKISQLRGIRADKVFCPEFKKSDTAYIKQLEIMVGMLGVKYGDIIFYK